MRSRALSASSWKSAAKSEKLSIGGDEEKSESGTGLFPHIPNLVRAPSRNLSTPATPHSAITALDRATTASASLSVRPTTNRRTLAQELDAIDSLLESIHRSPEDEGTLSNSQRSSRSNSISGTLSRTHRVDLADGEFVEPYPIRFSPDQLLFIRGDATTTGDDSLIVEVVKESGPEKSRVSRNPFDMPLPTSGKENKVDVGKGSDSTKGSKIKNSRGVREALAQPVSVIASTDPSAQVTKEVETLDADDVKGIKSVLDKSVLDLQSDEGELFRAEKEILRLMKSGCTREAAQLCKVCLEKMGELPSLLAMFRKLLKLLKTASSEPSDVKVTIKTANSIWLGDDIPISYRITPLETKDREFKVTGILALFVANNEQDRRFEELIQGAIEGHDSTVAKHVEREIDDLMTMDHAIIRLPISKQESSLLLNGRCIAKEGDYILRYYRSPLDISPVGQSKIVSVIQPSVTLQCAPEVDCDGIIDVSYWFFNKAQGEFVQRHSSATEGDYLKMRAVGPVKQNSVFEDHKVDHWTETGHCQIMAPSLPGDYSLEYFSGVSNAIVGHASFHARFQHTLESPEERGFIQCFIVHDINALEEIRISKQLAIGLDRMCEVLGIRFMLKSVDDIEALRNESLQDVLTSSFYHIGNSNYIAAFLSHDYSCISNSSPANVKEEALAESSASQINTSQISTSDQPKQVVHRPKNLPDTSIPPNKQLSVGKAGSDKKEKQSDDSDGTHLKGSKSRPKKIEVNEDRGILAQSEHSRQPQQRESGSNNVQAVTGSTSLMALRRSVLADYGSRSDLRALAKAGLIRKVADSEALIRAGDVLTSFYVVASGRFLDSEENVLMVGDIVGADGFLFSHPVVYDIFASGESSVLEIPRRALGKVSKDFKASILELLRNESAHAIPQGSEDSLSFEAGQPESAAEAELGPEEVRKLKFWEMKTLAAKRLLLKRWIPAYCSIVQVVGKGVGKVQRGSGLLVNANPTADNSARPFELQLAYAVFLRPQLAKSFVSFQLMDSCLSPRLTTDEYSESLNGHIRVNYDTLSYKAPKVNGARSLISRIGTNICREFADRVVDSTSLAYSLYMRYVSHRSPSNLSRHLFLLEKLSTMLERQEWSTRSKIILITGGHGAGKTWLLLKFASEFEDFAKKHNRRIIKTTSEATQAGGQKEPALFLSVNIMQFHFVGSSFRTLLFKICTDLKNAFASLSNKVLCSMSLAALKEDLIEMIQTAGKEATIILVIDNWECLNIYFEWLETLAKCSPSLVLIITRLADAASFKTVYKLQHMASFSITLDNPDYLKDRIRIALSFMQNYLADCNVDDDKAQHFSLEGIKDFMVSSCPNATTGEVIFLLIQQFERDQKSGIPADLIQRHKKPSKVDLDVANSFLQSLVEQDPDLLVCFRLLALVRSGLTWSEIAWLFESFCKKKLMRASSVREILVARHVVTNFAGMIDFASEGLRIAAQTMFISHDERAKYMLHVVQQFSTFSNRSPRKIVVLGQLSLDALRSTLPPLAGEDGGEGTPTPPLAEEKKDSLLHKQAETQEELPPTRPPEQEVVDWNQLAETLVLQSASAAAAGFCPRARAICHEIMAHLTAERVSGGEGGGGRSSDFSWADEMVEAFDRSCGAWFGRSRERAEDEAAVVQAPLHPDDRRLLGELARPAAEGSAGTTGIGHGGGAGSFAYGHALSKEERAMARLTSERRLLCCAVDLVCIVDLLLSHAPSVPGGQGAVLGLIATLFRELYRPGLSTVDELGPGHVPTEPLRRYETALLAFAAHAIAALWGALHRRFLAWAVKAKRTVEALRRRVSTTGHGGVAAAAAAARAAGGGPAAAGARLQTEKQGLLQEARMLVLAGKAVTARLETVLADSAADPESDSESGLPQPAPPDWAFKLGLDDSEDIYFAELRAWVLFRRWQAPEQTAALAQSIRAAGGVLGMLD